MDFSKLKTQNSLEKLTKKLEEQANKTNYTDDRYWQPTKDKAGNGTAIIRLLPVPPQDIDNEDALPWIKYFDHNFQGPGGWYIEKCLTTFGKPDPVAEYNNKLWNSGIESNKQIARQQKRNQRFVSGIQVISDPAKPENDGGVFLFRYGVKLFEKFQAAMNGDEDTPGFNPFDMTTGANFRIKIKTVKDKSSNQTYPSYEESKFMKQSSVSDDEEELKVIWMKQHSLLAEVAPEKFKTYVELKDRLNKVLAIPEKNEDLKTVNTPTAETKPLVIANKEPTEEKVIAPWEEPGEQDDTLSYFEKLANEV